MKRLATRMMTMEKFRLAAKTFKRTSNKQR